MHKKVLFIANPISGKGLLKKNLCDILERFSNADMETTVHITRFANDARDVVVQKGADYDYIVCSGGDGTLNETVSGLMSLEKKPVLGYIPAGTVNDFAYSFGLSKDMVKAAEIIVKGSEDLADVGRFNDRYFTYTAAFGAFTDVAYQTPQEQKNMLGRFAYLLEGAKRVPNIPSCHMRLESEGTVHEDEYIFGMVTNSLSIGGFRGICGRDIYMNDGLFEVMLVKYTKNLIQLQQIVDCVLHGTDCPGFVEHFKASSIKAYSKNIPWTLDGEFGGAPEIAEIENLKCAMSVIRG